MWQIVDELQTIERIADNLSHDPTLNNQQIVFLEHITRTAHRLFSIIKPMPRSSLAYVSLLPPMVSELMEPIVAIYGYARLLIDQPDSFGGAHLSPEHKLVMERIFKLGSDIANELEHLPRASMEARAEARQAPFAMVNVPEILFPAMAIWAYELRDTATQISLKSPYELPRVFAQVYHLREIVRHLIMTIARELALDATITLQLDRNDKYLLISFVSPQLAFNDDTLYTLFEHQGRALIRQQWQNMAGDLYLRYLPAGDIALTLTLPVVD